MRNPFLVAVLLVLAPVLAAQAAGEADTLPSAPSASVQQPPPPTAQAPRVTPAPDVQPVPKPAAATANPAPAKSAAADEPKSDVPGDSPTETIRVPVNEVNVVFTVTDKHGHFVKNLVQNDFNILDNKQPPQAVRSFRSETDLPLRVGLLVDVSSSIRERFKFEQEAAIEFLNQIVRPRVDEAFVLGFDTTFEITQPFTNDTGKLSQGVRLLRPGGGTALFDAVYAASRDILMKKRDSSTVRRAIILVTDGDDNQSRVTREEAIDIAQRAEVVIYCISTNNSNIVGSAGDKTLQRMADATGGRAFFPFQIQDVANAFSEIQEELRSQYALAYKPAELGHDGRYHAIEIIAQNHKFHVRSRRGYYAPAQQ